LVARNYPDGLEVEGESTAMWADPNYASHSIHSFGAHFAKIGVDADTGEVRLRRMLGVFSPGRVLNSKTARSQLIGGMTFGVGMALLEEAIVDPRSGAFVNCDLGEYLVPVHADIPTIDAVILDGFDLGIGILFGVAENEARRDAMVTTISPFWDGNETWLVVIGASLFAAFPTAYSVFRYFRQSRL